MKLLLTLFVIFVALGLYLVPRYTGLITSKYTSEEFGIYFGHSTNYVVTPRTDSDVLELRKADKAGKDSFVFIEKHRKLSAGTLAFRVAQEFGGDIHNAHSQSTEKLDGLYFNWDGDKGEESAFAFEGPLNDYILSTYGMPNDDVRLQFDKVKRSMALLED